MNIEVSGAVLSSLFYEHGASGSDLDGFLLGEITNKTTDTISDTQMNNIKEETTCYVYSYVVCRRPFTWYNSTGNVDVNKLKDILPKDKIKQVVGWYKFRRNATLRTSLREQVIHNNLLDCFSGVLPKNFAFLLCTPQQSMNMSTHTMEHVFLVLNNRQFRGLPVSVMNLGDSISPYKLHGASTLNCKAGRFSHTINKHSQEFLSRQGQQQIVTAANSMNSSIQQQLLELCSSVGHSEDELGQLRQDVKSLKTQLKPPVKDKPPPIRQDLNQYHGATGTSSSTASVLSPTNPFYTALSNDTATAVTTHTMDTDLPPSYAESYQTSHRPNNTNPFISAPTKLAPPDIDLILLRDSDEESATARNVNAYAGGYTSALSSSEDKPSTFMNMDISQPLIGEVHLPQSSFDSNNSNNSKSKSDAFDFITDVVRGSSTKTGSSSGGANSQNRDFNVLMEHGSRTTRSSAATKVSHKASGSRRAMEAIEVSSDEEHTQDMYALSSSPVY